MVYKYEIERKAKVSFKKSGVIYKAKISGNDFEAKRTKKIKKTGLALDGVLVVNGRRYRVPNIYTKKDFINEVYDYLN